ncbi:ABC transporter ATP-binding protein [Arcanobacterium phocae]|uniref:ABC transporter ATP-binding protein n=1 Tax=Arcanobacterium phocae TaxID=131112 RepID=UPI001C0EE2EE|nr:ABC transporter ATP-binding protein [Arcanobacterium phocae]
MLRNIQIKTLSWTAGLAIAYVIRVSAALVEVVAIANLLTNLSSNGGAALVWFSVLGGCYAVRYSVPVVLRYLHRVGGASFDAILVNKLVETMCVLPPFDVMNPHVRSEFERLVDSPGKAWINVLFYIGRILEIAVQGIGLSILISHTIGPLRASLPLLLIPPVVILSLTVGRKRTLLERKLAAPRMRRNYLESIFTHRTYAQEVRVFDINSPFAQDWQEKSESVRHILNRRELAYYGFLKFPVLGIGAALGLQLLVMTNDLVSGAVSIEIFTSFIVAYLSFVSSISWSLSESIDELTTNITIVRDIRRFITQSASPSSPEPSIFDAERDYRLTIEDLSFTYPGETNPVLDISRATFKAGMRYGICGENGAGKTTLANILMGVFPETDYQGALWIRSEDVRRRLNSNDDVGVVQYPYSFPVSGRDFLRLGDSSPLPSDDMEELFRGTGLAENPDRLITSGLADGTGLSGGQLKRLALARALSSSAPILILDEPSAWLDHTWLAWLTNRLEHNWKQRLVIIISHDEELLADCDVVMRLEKGALA